METIEDDIDDFNKSIATRKGALMPQHPIQYSLSYTNLSLPSRAFVTSLN